MATTSRYVTDDELLQAPRDRQKYERVNGERTAAIYRSVTGVRVIAEPDALDGEDVVPGFACTLKDVLG